MSWIVQSLWNNRERIKNGTRKDIGISYVFSLTRELSQLDEDRQGYVDPSIESDEFNDLLVVEKAVEELRELKLLSQQDIDILYGDREYHTTRMHRDTHSKQYSSVCGRIAYYLGGYFTDEGYINYITKKYRLTPEQQEVARLYMNSKFKNKVLRKGYKIDNRLVSSEV
jgi:hypothetical protein